MKQDRQHLTAAPKISRPARSGQLGFSLVELLVSITIFLIASTAMYGLMDIANKSRTITSERSDLMKNVRTAMTIVGRDAFNAGYSYPSNSVLLPDNRVSTLLNIPNDTDSTRDKLPPVVAGKNINANNLSGVNTDQVTFVFQDPTFNRNANGLSESLPVNEPTLVSMLGLDEIVPLSGNASSIRVNDLLLVTGRTSTTVGVVTSIDGSSVRFAGTDILGFNTPTAGDNPMRNIQAPTSLRRINMVTYRVLPTGVLVRTEYGNDTAATLANPSHDEPLVYGVERMQVDYVLDGGQLTRNPIAGPDNIQGTADDIPSNQVKVRQVRFTMTVRGSTPDQQGHLFSITMTSTFDTRNLGYDAA